ncbi:membrane hypothetical protein [Candidatus Competibacter denitrificans Run_A_D11]|uniref:DUF1109 domain-containing protein n=1 Tax=Candidatus Competibacter denitrificans Run_A_D11 TaxID=1400863 RepID=W6M5X3_9GAMM|nr:DUF1109 domain-containing protein [Candidatus Competibacter denitrificans]CDI03311.1 membrane hypothetical protein [Candidatus Competibacter denitrificans Run_A_D11]HAS87640.1 DUF1109 domain-containing protein [Candidatus Competibacteraceae bacterium]HRC68924.1 DUF1109 domain-containing protein [Candidatus Competibacter denitrificans]
MKTDDLITLLSQSPQPRKPLSFSLVLLACLAMMTAFTVFVPGLRPDLAIARMAVVHKTILLGAAAGMAGFLLKNAAKPMPDDQGVKLYLWLLVALYLGSIFFELITTPLSRIAGFFYTVNFPECLFFVTLYGAVGSWILLWLMRFYAPHDLKKAGMTIGFAAATTGAVGYSLHCTIDSPVFITIAYGLPVLLVSVIMRKLADKFIRW